MLKPHYKKPMLVIALVILLGFFALLLLNDMDYTVLMYGVGVLLLLELSYFVLCRMSMKDQYIFLIAAMLFSIGAIMLFRLNEGYGKKQIIWLGIGLIAFFISYFFILKTNIAEKIGFVYFGAAVLLPVITLLFATAIHGAKNWLIIGGVSIQTSEIVKYLVVFLLADRYTNPERYRLWGLPEGVVTTVMVYTVLGLMVLQREWGTAVVIFLLHFSMMYLFREKNRIIWINAALAVVGGTMGALIMPHIQQRIRAWIDPWSSIESEGYAIAQSLFAIGSGGFFGTGIGLGSPMYISEVHSDFIFSAVCEEFGILGGTAVIMLYFLLVYRGLRLSMNTKQNFYKAMSAGICILMGFQSFIILGGVIKMIPLTGITLPFISYGGSSLVVSFMAIGFLEGAANKHDLPKGGKPV